MSGMKPARRVLRRQWQLVLALAGARFGLAIRQLTERTGTSRQTLYRDLETLRDAGVPLSSSNSNGEARYRLLQEVELPALGLTPLQIAALHLARTELEPLSGAAFVGELDALLTKLRPIERQANFYFAERSSGHPAVVRALERAIEMKRRVRLEYRSAARGGARATVHVEPRFLRVADGDTYFRGYCIERRAERTYKVARVCKIDVTDEAATHAPDADASNVFAGAVKAWSGERTTVRIRIEGSLAWLLREFPLVADQHVEHRSDGSVVVEARVAGVVEAMRWVLSWGSGAEALEPVELRSAVRDELGRASRKYDGPGPSKATSAKSRRASGRLTRAATQGR